MTWCRELQFFQNSKSRLKYQRKPCVNYITVDFW